jgi:hypothetical protein
VTRTTIRIKRTYAIKNPTAKIARLAAAVGGFENRCHAVLELLAGRDVMCLKETKEGYPIHPLYVAADTEPTKYES